MANYPNLYATATINNGATVIITDFSLGFIPAVAVLATVPIVLLAVTSAGAIPTRPTWCGSEVAKGQPDGRFIVVAGTTFLTWKCEAAALVAAGAALLA